MKRLICALVMVVAVNCVAERLPDVQRYVPEHNGLRIVEAIAVMQENRLRLELVIENVGDKAITVATANTWADVRWLAAPLVPEFRLHLDAVARYKDRVLLPSLYRFAPVVLQPGEATLIVGDYPLGGNEQMPTGKVVVGYSVNPTNADSMGIWQGTFFSAPVDLLPQ